MVVSFVARPMPLCLYPVSGATYEVHVNKPVVVSLFDNGHVKVKCPQRWNRMIRADRDRESHVFGRNLVRQLRPLHRIRGDIPQDRTTFPPSLSSVCASPGPKTVSNFVGRWNN